MILLLGEYQVSTLFHALQSTSDSYFTTYLSGSGFMVFDLFIESILFVLFILLLFFCLVKLLGLLILHVSQLHLLIIVVNCECCLYYFWLLLRLNSLLQQILCLYSHLCGWESILSFPHILLGCSEFLKVFLLNTEDRHISIHLLCESLLEHINDIISPNLIRQTLFLPFTNESIVVLSSNVNSKLICPWYQCLRDTCYLVKLNNIS